MLKRFLSTVVCLIILFTPLSAYAMDSASMFLLTNLASPLFQNRNNSDDSDSSKQIYNCEFVNEDGKTIDSNNFYDIPTANYVQRILDNENNKIKNITTPGFKPSKKFLKCRAQSDNNYDITPTEYSCRVIETIIEDKNKVLSDKSYNIAQLLNESERIGFENHNVKYPAGKKRFQCVKKGLSYDVFDKKPKKHDTAGAKNHSDNFLSNPIFVIIAITVIIIVVIISRQQAIKNYQ